MSTNNAEHDPTTNFLVDVETRRIFLATLAGPEMEIPSLAEDLGLTETDVVMLALRALAAEAIETGLVVQQLREDVTGQEGVLKFFGALVSGLLGTPPPGDLDLDACGPTTVEEYDALDDGAKVDQFRIAARRTGDAIRQGALAAS